MLDKNTVTSLVKNIFTEKGYITEEDKSYSHKPHLASLPYDRRSTNFDELSERYSACMEKYYEHQKNVRKLKEGLEWHLEELEKDKKDLNDSLDKLAEWNEDNQKFFDADDKVRDKKVDWLSSVIKRAGENDLPDNLFNRVLGLIDYFEDTSYVQKPDQQDIYDLAGDIIDYRYSITNDDGEPIARALDGIADDIRVIGSNDYFDKNLPSLYDDAHSVGEMAGLQDHINIMQHNTEVRSGTANTFKKEITKETRLRDDFQDEADRTSLRCQDLGLLTD